MSYDTAGVIYLGKHKQSIKTPTSLQQKYSEQHGGRSGAEVQYNGQNVCGSLCVRSS